MAQKILVATDLSPSSKAGIRFALQLAAQNDSTLVFYSVIRLLKPTRWSENKYRAYAAEELNRATDRLRNFIAAEYRSAGMDPGRPRCVVEEGLSVDRSVIAYARRVKASYICLGTRGAGALKKMVGTTASVILTTSPVPVLIVPANYRRAPIRQIFYSSDFNNLGSELKKVKQFAAPLRAKIAVYHYDYLLNGGETINRLKRLSAKHRGGGVTFHFQSQDVGNSLVHHLKQDIKRSASSMAVLFTKQNRGWFERIFLSARSAELSFAATVPLLIFRKKT